MAYGTGGGSKFYYCTTVSPNADTVSEFAALTWVELTGVQDIAEFGDTNEIIKFKLLAENRVRKAIGSADAGDITVNCAHDPLSVSQAQMVTFRKNRFRQPFKVVLADGADANDTDSVFYFHGLVASSPLGALETDGVRTRKFNIAIDSEPVEQASTAVSGP